MAEGNIIPYTLLYYKQNAKNTAATIMAVDKVGAKVASSVNQGTAASANYIAQRDINGQLTVPETPTADGHAASKKYVDTQVGSVLPTQYTGDLIVGTSTAHVGTRLAIGSANQVLGVNSTGTDLEYKTINTVPTIASGDAGKVLTVNAAETGTEWATASSGGGGAFENISGSKVIKKAGFNSYGIDTNNQTGKYAEARNVILGGITSTDGIPILRDYYSRSGRYGNSEMTLIYPAAIGGSGTQNIPGGYGIFMGPTSSGARWDYILSYSSIFLENGNTLSSLSNDPLSVTNSLLIANAGLTAPFNSQIKDSIIMGNNHVLPENQVQGCLAAGLGLSLNNSNGFMRFTTVLGKYNTGTGLATNMGNGDYLQVGVGTANNARANCFTTGYDGTDDYIKIGDTKITETQLQALLATL